MFIKCWGARGSIPVSGKNYIKYGGDTTCIEIRNKEDDIIIVDAGTGIRRLGNHLLAEQRTQYYFIITHAHWDHLMGFPFFKPLYSDQTEIRVLRCPFPADYTEKMISRVLKPPNFPIKYSDLKENITYVDGCPSNIKVGGIKIMPIPLSHPNKGRGYKFVQEGKIFVFLTDNELGFVHPGGLSYKKYVDFARDADLLFHDAEYTPEEYKNNIEWGHSTYMDALNLAIEAGVKQFGLFHHNQDRKDDELDAIVNTCKKIVAQKGIKMNVFAVGTDMTFTL